VNEAVSLQVLVAELVALQLAQAQRAIPRIVEVPEKPPSGWSAGMILRHLPSEVPGTERALSRNAYQTMKRISCEQVRRAIIGVRSSRTQPHTHTHIHTERFPVEMTRT
jgi:hypothetical protein